VEGDTLAGQAIDTILDRVAGTSKVAGEGAQAHAGAAEAFKCDQIDEAFSVIVDGERLDGEGFTAMRTNESPHGAEGFGFMAAVV
jgi:hypothetical protein